MPINFETDYGKVRLLLNDVDETALIFSDNELQAFLALENGSVKRAAAQAIDTNASNLALATRVLQTQDLNVDGAKLADALRAHADRLRDQADVDESSFQLVAPPSFRWPELTEQPRFPFWGTW